MTIDIKLNKEKLVKNYNVSDLQKVKEEEEDGERFATSENGKPISYNPYHEMALNTYLEDLIF